MAHPLRAMDPELAERAAGVARDRYREVGYALLRPQLASSNFSTDDDRVFSTLYGLANNNQEPDAELVGAAWAAVEAEERDAAAMRAAHAGWVKVEGWEPAASEVAASARRAALLRAFASLYTAEHEDRLLDVVLLLRNSGAGAEEVSGLLAGKGA
ncbi:hypothetical protein [Segniliparus rugosus]|uniref:Uncharacterized protein n=1 Tax=Segniliparus rugosus (strain ATCC BAA-974 / DSM 45345 / CCUG 50838 / CIP 108380 / JCM 13579 / CDC 945) TaxID=679197 RepID=E5XQH7_SEGRC|nr:hypothetical protein [Segniliparus rugosus]EFV13395.1 hypothetical protein HMPREF9336_01749 [Segniliparus rugosus ATCC BAA-974]